MKYSNSQLLVQYKSCLYYVHYLKLLVSWDFFLFCILKFSRFWFVESGKYVLMAYLIWDCETPRKTIFSQYLLFIFFLAPSISTHASIIHTVSLFIPTVFLFCQTWEKKWQVHYSKENGCAKWKQLLRNKVHLHKTSHEARPRSIPIFFLTHLKSKCATFSQVCEVARRFYDDFLLQEFCTRINSHKHERN